MNSVIFFLNNTKEYDSNNLNDLKKLNKALNKYKKVIKYIDRIEIDNNISLIVKQ